MNMTKEIRKLEDIHKNHQPLRFKELVSPQNRPKRLIGINGTHLLLKLLERSNDLIEESLFAIRRHKTLTLILHARAHFETTASLGYFSRKLKKFYVGTVSETEFDATIGNLSTGTRLKDVEDEEVKFPDAIGVMTLIDETDKLLKDMGSEIKMFRPSYDRLSEYNHPNLLGTTYKTRVELEKGTVRFLSDQESFERHSKSVVLKLLISADLFLHFYSQTFELLEINEEMPALIKG